MAYKVRITPPAKHQLEMYIAYTANELRNKQAARAIKEDAVSTARRLAEVADNLAFCNNEVLAKNGYRRIFFEKHDFFMVYRIENNYVIVDAMYHELQDYEAVFINHLK